MENKSSEDKLFEILSRPDIWVMRKKYREFCHIQWKENVPSANDLREKFFNQYGWSVKEYVQEHLDRNIPLPHD